MVCILKRAIENHVVKGDVQKGALRLRETLTFYALSSSNLCFFFIHCCHTLLIPQRLTYAFEFWVFNF